MNEDNDITISTIVEDYLKKIGVNYPSSEEDKTSWNLLTTIVHNHGENFPFCTANHMLHYHHLHNNDSKKYKTDNGDGETTNHQYDNTTNNKNNENENENYDHPGNTSTTALYYRLCHQRSGGYCFEQNKLLHDVLHHLGYDVRLVLARVFNNQPAPYRPPLTHRITLVRLRKDQLPATFDTTDDGWYHYFIIDCAFGGENSPAIPLSLPHQRSSSSSGVVSYNVNDATMTTTTTTTLSSDGIISYGPTVEDAFGSTGHRTFRIVHDPNDVDPFRVEVSRRRNNDFEDNGEWYNTIKFDLSPIYDEADCELSHFYSMTSPRAIFTTNLLVGRHVVMVNEEEEEDDETEKEEQGRMGEIRLIWNLSYKISSPLKSRQKEITISSFDQLYSIMREDFGVTAFSLLDCQILFDILVCRTDNT